MLQRKRNHQQNRIDCINVLEDANGVNMEALEKRPKHLRSMRHTDYLVMFEEDEGLLDVNEPK